MSKFLNISTDNTLGGSSASDEVVSSQKAVKGFVENKGYLTQAVDDTSTTSTTLGWSASKLNTMIGDIETLLSQV